MKSEKGSRAPWIIDSTYMRPAASPYEFIDSVKSPCKPRRHYAESIEYLFKNNVERSTVVDFPSKEELKP